MSAQGNETIHHRMSNIRSAMLGVPRSKYPRSGGESIFSDPGHCLASFEVMDHKVYIGHGQILTFTKYTLSPDQLFRDLCNGVLRYLIEQENHRPWFSGERSVELLIDKRKYTQIEFNPIRNQYLVFALPLSDLKNSHQKITVLRFYHHDDFSQAEFSLRALPRSGILVVPILINNKQTLSRV